MKSSSPQLPPRNVAGRGHRVNDAPPPIETFFKLPNAANATHWPLGEKNGP